MSWWKRVLKTAGVHVVRDVAPPTFRVEGASEGRYVFVLDDEVSRMSAVVGWLQASFELSPVEAATTMATIHNYGYGALGPFEASRARDLVLRARFEATKRGLDGLCFSTDVPPADYLEGRHGALARARDD